MLAVGALGMPALIWSTLEGRSFLGYYGEFYGDIARFQGHWFPGLIAVVIPLFLFEAVCTYIWFWKNHNQGMRDVLRPVGIYWLIMAFVVGQFVTWGLWYKLFLWSADYNPITLWVVGGILLFAIIPTITISLALAIAAFASERWLTRSKVTLRILSVFMVPSLIMVGTQPEIYMGLTIFGVPFAIAQICASLGLAATFDGRKDLTKSPEPPH